MTRTMIHNAKKSIIFLIQKYSRLDRQLNSTCRFCRQLEIPELCTKLWFRLSFSSELIASISALASECCWADRNESIIRHRIESCCAASPPPKFIFSRQLPNHGGILVELPRFHSLCVLASRYGHLFILRNSFFPPTVPPRSWYHDIPTATTITKLDRQLWVWSVINCKRPLPPFPPTSPLTRREDK